MSDPALAVVDPADHLNLARLLARRYAHLIEGGYPEAEAIAFLGLVKASHTYRATRGRWSTYAGRVITNALLRSGRAATRRSQWRAELPPTVDLSELLGAEDARLATVEVSDRLPLARVLGAALPTLSDRERALLMDCARHPQSRQRERAVRLGRSAPWVGHWQRRLRATLAPVLDAAEWSWRPTPS